MVWEGLAQAHCPTACPGQLWNEVVALICWVHSSKLINELAFDKLTLVPGP